MGGSSNKAPVFVSAAKAHKLKHGAKVNLEGVIVRQKSSEEYDFEDDTGKITISIPYQVWSGIKLQDNQPIRIRGMVDRYTQRTFIKVDKIIPLN